MSSDIIGTHRTTVAGDPLEGIDVTYHRTKVVRFKTQMQARYYGLLHTEVTLDSGGWRTPTTKRRMNQTARQFGLGFMVYQKKGEWFVDLPRQNRTLPFEDGMVFSV